MSNHQSQSQRILAIVPKSRGFGFIIMESQTRPIDWGFRTCRAKSIRKEILTLSRIEALIDHYQPSRILVEKLDKDSRRGNRVRLLLETIQNHATWRELKLLKISFAKVRKVFETFRATTKQEIAGVVVGQIGELAPLLPRPRREWTAEHDQMAVFDAAALALTYFYTRPISRKSGHGTTNTASLVQSQLLHKSMRNS